MTRIFTPTGPSFAQLLAVLTRNTNSSPRPRGIERVADEIGNHLTHLVSKTGHEGCSFALAFDRNVLVGQALSKEDQDRVNEVADIYPRRLVRLLIKLQTLSRNVPQD